MVAGKHTEQRDTGWPQAWPGKKVGGTGPELRLSLSVILCEQPENLTFDLPEGHGVQFVMPRVWGGAKLLTLWLLGTKERKRRGRS
jgi:hypothetical protein